MAQRIRDLIDPGLPLGFGEVEYEHDQRMLLRGDIIEAARRDRLAAACRRWTMA